MVKRNAEGRRVGESHPKAELTDRDVELMRELRDEGRSYRWLAKTFEIPKRTVRDIVNYRRRCA